MGKRNLPSNRDDHKGKDDNVPVVQNTSIKYAGPLPPPGILQGYKDIDPEILNLILSDFEKNAEHTRAQEKVALQAQVAEVKRGQKLAFFVIICGLVATTLLSYLDKDVAAIATGISTAVFVFTGRLKKN